MTTNPGKRLAFSETEAPIIKILKMNYQSKQKIQKMMSVFAFLLHLFPSFSFLGKDQALFSVAPKRSMLEIFSGWSAEMMMLMMKMMMMMMMLMMKMMMMMMMMITQLSSFSCVGFSFTLGLKSLPHLSDSSCLKKLDAENCDIQSLPDNLLHYHMEEIYLKGNKGKVVMMRRQNFAGILSVIK